MRTVDRCSKMHSPVVLLSFGSCSSLKDEGVDFLKSWKRIYSQTKTPRFFNKVGRSVNPWRTGLSGQLQKEFLTGIPTLKRSEIEAACEDFSNVIGSCPIGKMFKGTLSSGVEIAVASIVTISAKDWKDNTEIHFRKKVAIEFGFSEMMINNLIRKSMCLRLVD